MDSDTKTSPKSDKSRPLSGTEYSLYRAVQTGSGVAVLSLHLSRPIPLPMLQTALHKLIDSNPILSSSLTPTTVHVITPPPPPTIPTVPATSFHSVLERELNLNPWASTPSSQSDVAVGNFYATVYELDAGAAVVALRFHSGVCDRTSGMVVLKGLLGMIRGKDASLRDGEVRSGMEEMIRREDSCKPFWARGKDVVGYVANGMRASELRFEDVDRERRSEVVRLLMSREETQRLLCTCEERGVKLCGALSAAGLIAAYFSKHLEKDQQETYSLITLIDCRKYLDPVLADHHVGFYHSAILNTHAISGSESVWEVALRCHDSYSTAKANKKHLTDLGELNFLMCKAIDNPHLTPSSSLRTAVISVFEEPVIYDNYAELQTEIGLEDYIGCASVHGVGPSIAIFDLIRDGQLDCACVYPSPLHSRNQVTELVENMKQILLQGCCDDSEVEKNLSEE